MITRPDATKEFVISDHLGSVRALFNEQGVVLQRLDYEPNGKELVSEDKGARTSFIGRERDGESDLGFFGVRLYDADYGRFLSTDKLWEKYAAWQPYQYAVNSPLSYHDAGGAEVEAADNAAEMAIRASVPGFEDKLKFGDNGVLDATSTKLLAKGAPLESNIAILSRLAENDVMIRVSIAGGYSATRGGVSESKRFYSGTSTFNSETTSFVPALTLLPKREPRAESLAGQLMPVSTSGKIECVISTQKAFVTGLTAGQLAAHEIFSHARRYLLWKIGMAADFWHTVEESRLNGTDTKCKELEGKAGGINGASKK